MKVSGGRPWVAAQCWRATAVIGLLLCAWGVRRIVSLRGGNATAAVLAVANPAVLIIVVGGIHSDALMLGLAVAGVALALSGQPAWGILLGAVGVAVKPNALLVVGALAWWAWGGGRRQRLVSLMATAGAVIGVLFVAGLVVGGGFGWVRSISSYGWVPGPWALGPVSSERNRASRSRSSRRWASCWLSWSSWPWADRDGGSRGWAGVSPSWP